LNQPQWWSQPFAPEGSAAAEGIAKQLGRPNLDDLTILVREAAQNSWDARQQDATPHFCIQIRALGSTAAEWRAALLPAPSEESLSLPESVLQPESLVIVVSDRNTAGLSGPIRAGVRARPEEGNDFVQFLRNVGEPRDQLLGGGTYGFGKGIFYKLSSASTILVDSNVRVGAGYERRLMAASLGSSYYDETDRRFTGRHWWGRLGEDNVPDPILADAAATTAQRLGLPGFDNGATGTDIVILGADLGVIDDGEDARARTADEAGLFIGSSILWHLWPKLVGLDPTSRMTFEVSVNGVDVPIPDPSALEELRPFVEALLTARGTNGVPYKRRSTPKTAGYFAVSLGAADVGTVLPIVSAASPFSGPSHHVARMRHAELVVDYMETMTHPNALLRYGGVFRGSAEADEHFAAAEPPTHDDWVERGLVGVTKTVVVGARQFIRRRIESEFHDSLTMGGQGGSGLGALATRLGSLVPQQVSSSDATDRSRGRRALAGSSRSKVPRIVDGPKLVVGNGPPFVVTRVRIAESYVLREYEALVTVVLDGGTSEASAPLGDFEPTILQWLPVSGGNPVFGGFISISPGPESEWWVYATYVPEAVLRIKVAEVKHHA
jgi:hypothetical protein